MATTTIITDKKEMEYHSKLLSISGQAFSDGQLAKASIMEYTQSDFKDPCEYTLHVLKDSGGVEIASRKVDGY